MTKFDHYLALKKEFNIEYGGISYDKILAHEYLLFLVFYKEKLRSRSLIGLFGQMFKRMDLTDLKNTFVKSNICFTVNSVRQDNIALIESYCSEIPESQIVYLQKAEQKRFFRFNFLTLIDCFKEVFFREVATKLSFKEKFCIYTHLVHYVGIVQDLDKLFERIDLAGKKLFTFNSSFGLETLLTLYFKKRGVKTYHLSHGLSYVNFNVEKPMDAVNGENITSDKIVVWGETSKNDLITNYSIDRNRILIGGNPRYPEKKLNVNRDFKKCIVFLARPAYDGDNFKLMSLLGRVSKKHGLSFSIKPHPLSDKNKLESLSNEYGMHLVPQNMTIDDVLRSNEFDYAISYNTTVYYEAMYYNLICFRYSVNLNEDYTGLNDLFDSEESLIANIETFKEIDKPVLNDMIEMLLKETLGMGINNYRKIAVGE